MDVQTVRPHGYMHGVSSAMIGRITAECAIGVTSTMIGRITAK